MGKLGSRVFAKMASRENKGKSKLQKLCGTKAPKGETSTLSSFISSRNKGLHMFLGFQPAPFWMWPCTFLGEPLGHPGQPKLPSDLHTACRLRNDELKVGWRHNRAHC